MRCSLALVIVTVAAAAQAAAAPYTPASSEEVVERVPVGLRAEGPPTAAALLELSKAQLTLARETGEPRYVGQAARSVDRALELGNGSFDSASMLQRADVLQFGHRFGAALEVLDAVVEHAPADSRARLMRASILTVQGRYTDARKDCLAILGKSSELVGLTCGSLVGSLSGNLDGAGRAMDRVVERLDELSLAEQDWALSIAADIARRSGSDDKAFNLYRRAVERSKRSSVLPDYADFLLDRNRNAEVVELLADYRHLDAILLRWVIAAERLGHAESGHWGRELSRRMEALARDTESGHTGELARYELDVRRDARAALVFAKSNWENQREPGDLRLLIRSGAAAGDTVTLGVARAWIERTKTEDAEVARLLASGAPS